MKFRQILVRGAVRNLCVAGFFRDSVDFAFDAAAFACLSVPRGNALLLGVAAGPGAAMILESAVLDVKPGKAQEFEAAFTRAQSIIAASPGYLSHELQRCIEKPNRYLLLVRWRTLEDHTDGFRKSGPSSLPRDVADA